MLVVAALLVVVVSVVYVFYSRSSSSSSSGRRLPLPPGPRGWPLVGNLPLLLSAGGSQSESENSAEGKGKGRKVKKPLHALFSDLRRRHGPVVSLSVAGKRVVLLNGFDVISEAMGRHEFNAKPTTTLVANISQNQGLLASNGSLWREHRRFTVMWLRNLGLGKSVVEESVSTEVQEVCAALLLTAQQSSSSTTSSTSSSSSTNSTTFDPRALLFPSVLNVTWSLAVGKRFELDDPKLHRLMNVMQENIRIAVQSGPLNFMPWLRFIPVIGDSYWKLKSNVADIYSFLEGIMDESKATLDSGGDFCTDLLQEYLRQARKESDNDNTTFTDGQIRRVLTDLFIAGSETTVTTLTWALLLLVKHPSVQRRVQDEIDRVVGGGRPPSTRDRSQMPLTEATLAEVQRFSSIVPFVTHAVDVNTELAGYRVASGTIVLANLWSVMRDPDLWREPDEFRIERFLDEEESGGTVKFVKPDHFIPFSVGKRACLGESLARAELFLFLTTILQKFTISTPGGDNDEVCLDHVPGVTMAPKDQLLVATPR